MNRRINIITMLIIILAVLIVFAGLAVSSLLKTAKAIQEDPMSAFETEATPLILESSVVATPTASVVVPHDVEYKGVYYQEKDSFVNIVLLGFDDVEDRPDDGGNTDSLMVFQIDFDTAAVNVISIPRDSWALINEYDAKGNLEYTYHTKINAAFSAAARKQDRYPNAMTAIQNLLGVDGLFDINFDYYCSIDIKDVPQIVKVVGGVPITLDATIPNVGIAGETVTLTEETCETYLRDRSTGEGDVSRASRHQQFMIALAKRIQALGGKKAALTLYDDAVRYIDTNLSLEQIAAVAAMMDDINVDAISLYAVPGVIGGTTYERPGSHFGDYRSAYLVDSDALAELILKLYYEPVTP
jgi:polyisoprenyl-teichoic acid--peptidoglycan teichoic acid transferase